MNLLRAAFIKSAADYVPSPELQQRWQQSSAQEAATPQMWIPHPQATAENAKDNLIKNPAYVNPYSDERKKWQFQGRGLEGLGRDVADTGGQVAGGVYRAAAGLTGAIPRTLNWIRGAANNWAHNKDYYWNYLLKGDPMGAKKMTYVDTPDWEAGGYRPARSGYGLLNGNQGYWGQMGSQLEGAFRDFVEPITRTNAAVNAPTLQSIDQARPGQGFWMEAGKAPAQHPWKRVSPGYYQNQAWTPESTQPYMMAAPQEKQSAAIETPDVSTNPATPTQGVQGAESLVAAAPMPSTAQSSANAAITQGADVSLGGQGKAGSWLTDKLGDLSSKRDWMKASPYSLDFDPQITSGDPAPSGNAWPQKVLQSLNQYLFDPGTQFGHTKGVIPSAVNWNWWRPALALQALANAGLPFAYSAADKLRGLTPTWTGRAGKYMAPDLGNAYGFPIELLHKQWNEFRHPTPAQ